MEKKLLRDIIQWDVYSWQRALLYWEKNVNWSQVATVLELGGNNGGLSLWLALKGKKVICSDIVDVYKTAYPLHAKYGVSSLIQYEIIDATNIPYENYFDVIVFKSIIGGIGRNNNLEKQYKVFEQIHKALKNDGQLLFAENLIASPLHQQMRKRFIQWGTSWRYVSLEEMKDFLKIFKSYQINTTGVLATFGRNEWQRGYLAILDDFLFNKICPDEWKYIAYGIAKK